jgi:hypothetical protein
MRLTVGPLPAAVYWRRRAFVLAVTAVVAFGVFYSCSNRKSVADGHQPSPTSTASSPTGAPASTLLSPTSPGPTATTGGAGGGATPTSSAFTLPTTSVSGACTDAELLVSASAATAQARRGLPLDVTIKFRNTGFRTCSRDIGADLQELRVTAGKALIWSSDDCNANHGHDVESFAPGRVISFTLHWTGRVSRSGTGAVLCSSSAPFPPLGEYELLGRLDSQISEPFSFRLT